MGRRLGRQRGKAWWPASSGVAGVSPYEEKRGGGDGSGRQPHGAERGVVRAADSDAAMTGAVTVGRARRCATRKKRGKCSGTRGKKGRRLRKGSSRVTRGGDTGRGSGPGPELGARAMERGRAAHERGKGWREGGGRVSRAWNTWAGRGEGKKWVGPEGTGGFSIYLNKIQLAQNILIKGWTYLAPKILNKIWLERD
jgi:hypothetical protein